MKKLNFEEVRSIQIVMLQRFIEFCKLHNLRYFVDAGTLLGTIRHDGFIPWDDDIDVAMPRPDYNKFVKLARKGFGSSLVLLEPKDGIYPMLKIIDTSTYMLEFPETIKNKIGVYIDVFPKDGIKSESILSHFRCKLVHFLVLLNWFNKVSIFKWKNDSNPIRRILSKLGKRFVTESNKNIPLNILLWLAEMRSFDSSVYSATIVAGGMANCVETNLISEYRLHKFETLEVNIPVGWDDYLKKLYGNYMKIPSLENRIKHDNIAYIID